MKKKFEDGEVSSGNVFADLGFPDAEEMLAKSDLAIQITDLIKKKKLTQLKAADLLGIDQPKISNIIQGKLAGFSLERLFKFLTILGQDITINISPKSKSRKKARMNVHVSKKVKRPIIEKSGPVLYAKKRK